MTWINFLTYLVSCYVIYYLINLAYDFYYTKNLVSPPIASAYEVDIPEPIDASVFHDIANDEIQESYLSSGELDSAGGLIMENLLLEVKKGIIEHTAKISF